MLWLLFNIYFFKRSHKITSYNIYLLFGVLEGKKKGNIVLGTGTVDCMIVKYVI